MSFLYLSFSIDDYYSLNSWKSLHSVLGKTYWVEFDLLKNLSDPMVESLKPWWWMVSSVQFPWLRPPVQPTLMQIWCLNAEYYRHVIPAIWWVFILLFFTSFFSRPFFASFFASFFSCLFICCVFYFWIFFFNILFSDYFIEQLRQTRMDPVLVLPVLTVKFH